MVVALGVEDRRLDIVDGDERSTAVKRRGAEPSPRPRSFLALARQPEADQPVDVIAQSPASLAATSRKLSGNVGIKVDRRGARI